MLINRIDYYLGTSSIEYVVFGKAAGFTEFLNLASIDGSNGFSLISTAAVGNLSNAGDVNGDGFDDVIVSDSTSSYVVYGKAFGFDSRLSLTNLDGGDGFRLSGAGSGFPSILAVSNAGDVNNDGFGDLIIGNRFADSNGQDAGSSYILFGADFIGNVVHIGTPGNDILTGISAAERFEGGDGNDSLDGKGGADVFYGGTGKDTISVPDLNFQSVDGGTGTDILKFTGRGVNVNLADFQGRIKGIETIDMTGDFGNNNLTLSLQDLKSLSDTTTTFTINGITGDRVFGLGSNWTDHGIQNGYHRYTNQGTVLRIDPDIRTDAPNPGMIYFSDLDGDNGFRLSGNFEYSSANVVSNAGDVNGDGYEDVIINAYGSRSVYDNPYSHIYVVFGKASGFDSFLSLSNLDSSSGFRLRDQFKYNSISNAGDVNGDGFDDLIIGSGTADHHGRQSGSSYVVFGKAAGFDTTMDLSTLDGNNGFRLDGVAAYDLTGYSVSEAGDVNGDGFDDLIVGAFFADPHGSKSGSSYVVFGKATGFGAEFDFSNLDGNNGFRLDGVAAYDGTGQSSSSAGDVNGDGFDDVIVSAPGADNQHANPGAVYVIFGKATGFNSTMNLSSLDGNNGFRLDGLSEGDRLGTSISNAGDVNGDDFDDVIVITDNEKSDTNYGYVVFGKATGFGAEFDLSNLDGTNGFSLNGVISPNYLDPKVSSAGDVNGDGFDDLMIGDSGNSYIVFGSESIGMAIYLGTPEDDNLTGTLGAERFEGGKGNDRMIGLGGIDTFYGDAGDDYIRINDLNFQLIDGGAGKDTLGLSGSNLNLDLTAVGDKIEDIETIYLYGIGDNTLTLTAEDLINLSDSTNTLKVNGNAGDHIVGLSTGWTDGGVSGGFHIYTQDAAVLLVGVNVTTDFTII